MKRQTTSEETTKAHTHSRRKSYLKKTSETPNTIKKSNRIVFRIQHDVKIAFVIFIVSYCYKHSNTC